MKNMFKITYVETHFLCLNNEMNYSWQMQALHLYKHVVFHIYEKNPGNFFAVGTSDVFACYKIL